MANPPEITQTKRTYTIREAVAYMKLLEKQPTTCSITWVRADTGKEVAIGYSK